MDHPKTSDKFPAPALVLKVVVETKKFSFTSQPKPNTIEVRLNNVNQ